MSTSAGHAGVPIDLAGVGVVTARVAPQLRRHVMPLQKALQQQLPQTAVQAIPAQTNPEVPPNGKSAATMEALVSKAAFQVLDLSSARKFTELKHALMAFALQLTPPPNAYGLTKETASVLAMMDRCSPLVRAHLMGVCHYVHSGIPRDAVWPRSLRDDASGSSTHRSVVVHHLPLPSDSAQRVETIQAILVRLSWLAPARHDTDDITHIAHVRSLDEGVRELTEALQTHHFHLNASERDVFFKDLKAAFVSECCSPLVARAARTHLHVDWMKAALGPPCDTIAAEQGATFFPEDGPIKSIPPLELMRRADTPPELIGRATALVVRNAADEIARLLDGNQLAAARQLLESLVDLLRLPKGTESVPLKARAALDALEGCNPIARAYIMGMCHFCHDIATSSAWKRKLRFDKAMQPISMKHLITGYADMLADPSTRGDAIKGVFVHLSWLAMPATTYDGRYLPEAIGGVFLALESAYGALPRAQDRAALLKDIENAIEQRYCSSWLVVALKQATQTPVWLKGPLSAALHRMASGQRSELFTLQRFGWGDRGARALSALQMSAVSVGVAGAKRSSDEVRGERDAGAPTPKRRRSAVEPKPLDWVQWQPPKTPQAPLQPPAMASQNVPFKIPSWPAADPLPTIDYKALPRPPLDPGERWAFFLADPTRMINKAVRTLRIDIVEKSPLDQPGGLHRMLVLLLAIATQARTEAFYLSDGDRVFGLLKRLVKTAKLCRPGHGMPWKSGGTFWDAVRLELRAPEMSPLRRCLRARLEDEGTDVPADVVAQLNSPTPEPQPPQPHRAQPAASTRPQSAAQTHARAAEPATPLPFMSPQGGEVLSESEEDEPSNSVPPTSVETPEGLLCHRATVCVGQAAAQLEPLLLTDPVDVPAVKQVLWRLAEELAQALTQPTATMDMVLAAALAAMSRCKSVVVRAHLMGACHYLHMRASYAEGWRSGLRGESTPTDYLSHATVLNRLKLHLYDPAQRASALKAMVVHLSWLAPVWSEADSIQQRAHVDSLRHGLTSLFDALNKPYAELASDAERAAFQQDVVAAFGPATCSHLLATYLKGVRGVPFWLDDELLAARENLLASNAVQIFPTEQHVTQLSRAELVDRPDAPDEMIREAMTAMVNEVADQVDALLKHEESLASLSEALEANAHALARTLELPCYRAELTRAQKYALQAMVACRPVVRAHLLGSCGYLHIECVPNSFWQRAMRFEEADKRTVTYQHIFAGYKEEFDDPLTRGGAIKGLMAHLSWLAPAVLRDTLRKDDLLDVVNKLFQALRTASDEALTPEELNAIRQDLLSAIAPAYCSYLLIHLFSAATHVPHWLQDPLRAALEALKSRGGQFFPLLENVPKKGGQASHVRTAILPPVQPRMAVPPTWPAPLQLPVPIPEVPSGPFGEAVRISRWVAAQAVRIEFLLNGGDLAAASAALKTLAEKLEPLSVNDGEALSQNALFVWKTMLSRKPFVGAQLMGVCHFFHASSVVALWKRYLRYNGDIRKAATLEGVVVRHTAQLQLHDKRVEALKAMLAQLSWLAPPWYTPGEQEERHRSSLESALRLLAQGVQVAYTLTIEPVRVKEEPPRED
ncbi:hypothetical protein [Hydrogenophaga sp.]|uniref:hypothetical protein n=1 Tax=Hydrogenophaga sp. TaxID=1904254 RepID=UPI00271E0036|nr:hypothetical protein [Hydrogenophaga sp.]MDO9437352.1 hypothetical protein [Hydrogenophaga sp.]